MNKSLLFLPALLVACSSPEPETADPIPVEPKVVNLYTHRHYDTDKELFAAFTAKTGIEVNVVQAGDDELMARLEAEGAKSPCDLFITADAGRLGLAKTRGLLQPSTSEVLSQNIPANLRDPEGYWYGLTMRARVIAYNKNKVKADAIRTYDDLTKAQWKGRLLVRSSENVYNQSLMAALIAHQGVEAATKWAKGIVKNMARDPKGGDTDQMLAIGDGLGDIAIVNSYYAGKLLASDEPEKQKAKALIALAFPVFHAGVDGGTPIIGTHVNVSGGGVATHAPHKAEAMELLEYLSGTEAQGRFAEGNKEYPVKAGVAMAKELEAFGSFTMDSLNLEALGRLNGDAVKALDAAGWR
ncbi:MAG: Fe(3+) ABC transporter substrate-binding protein [Flavobacteriales bacterium]